MLQLLMSLNCLQKCQLCKVRKGDSFLPASPQILTSADFRPSVLSLSQLPIWVIAPRLNLPPNDVFFCIFTTRAEWAIVGVASNALFLVSVSLSASDSRTVKGREPGAKVTAFWGATY